MKLASDLGQLTYCTNIHAGEPLDDVMQSLADFLPGIKSRVCPDAAFGVGLRLGATAADALGDPEALAGLKALLAAGNYYVFTLNGFPYGAFHGQPVKDGAYRPDWADPERLRYTNHLADLLVQIMAPESSGSISTVPGSFKPWAQGNVDRITAHLIDHVAHLVQLHRTTGQSISLALEPEPFCFLETIDESVAYFKEHLFASPAIEQLIAATGINHSQAEQALHHHIGICYDVCHAAVEFESAADSLREIRQAGIGIGKLQLSSALRLATVDAAGLERIRSFDEPVYLHQVVQKKGKEIQRFADISDALMQAESAIGSEWRVHFHVPVFLPELPEFDTTQSFLAEILALHRQQKISDHLEVETYTWDVLPPGLRSVALDEAIARELNWVLSQLGQPAVMSAQNPEAAG
ncbi:MAG: metabolite traffic protein EboE [Burkholderiaceae bacterium]